MNENYIDMLRDLYTSRWSTIITDHGPTSPHHIEAGLDQGETHAPILWRIFYDPLLYKIAKTKQHSGYTIDTVIRHPTNMDLPAYRQPNFVNHLAFVDDTIWIANSKDSTEAILLTANKFFTTHDIEINFQKTELLIVRKSSNLNSHPASVRFGDSEITSSKPNTPHRYLGIWITDTNNNKHTVKLINAEIDMMGKTVKNKPITDKLMSYIIRAVLHPSMEYRTQGIYLSKPETEKLDSKVRSIFRTKANISRSTGSKTIHHPDFYGIPKFEDIQFMARTSELLYDLNSPNLEGTITRARMSQYQWDS